MRCVVTHFRDQPQRQPARFIPLILRRGHCPFGCMSPAVLAANANAELADFDTVLRRVAKWVKGPQHGGYTPDAIAAMWQDQRLTQNSDFCPDGCIPRAPFDIIEPGSSHLAVGFGDSVVFSYDAYRARSRPQHQGDYRGRDMAPPWHDHRHANLGWGAFRGVAGRGHGGKGLGKHAGRSAGKGLATPPWRMQ